jgi:DNA-binding NarL/FixJ family response regulator
MLAIGSTGGVVDRVRVVVRAAEPMVRAGVLGCLAASAEIDLLPDNRLADAHVLVVVVDSITVDVMRSLREVSRQFGPRCVVIARDLRAANVLAMVDCGVVGLMTRVTATPKHVVGVVLAAGRGQGALSPDAQGALFEQLALLSRDDSTVGIGRSALTAREIDVLRLISEGWETREIGTKLSYSERTVKNIVHGVLVRLGLRNRAQAVAYALRAGLM